MKMLVEKIPFEETQTIEISEFDIQFIRDVFAQEKIALKRDDFRLKKTFLLTGIKNTEDTDSHLEMFVYEILFTNDINKKYPDLTKKPEKEAFVRLFPETKAPYTCYLFPDNDKFFVIGYYGLDLYYEPFDIDPFISGIKNKKQD